MEGYEERAHKQIQIESWSNSARTLNLRGATPGGPFAESHTTNADRSRATDTYEIHGIPSRLQVSPSAAPVRRGECYVRLTLMMDGEPVERLASAYLTDSKTLSWPTGIFEDFLDGSGNLTTIVGTDPAQGVEISEAVPTNAVWLLRGMRFTLVAAAGGGDRTPRLLVDDGSNNLFSFPSGIDTVANGTQVYATLPGIGFDPSRAGLGDAMIAIPNYKLDQGFNVATSTAGLAGTDNYGPPVLYIEEWLQE